MPQEDKPDRLGDYLVQQDAQRQATVTNASNLEAILARVSAEITAQAERKRAEKEKSNSNR